MEGDRKEVDKETGAPKEAGKGEDKKKVREEETGLQRIGGSATISYKATSKKSYLSK